MKNLLLVILLIGCVPTAPAESWAELQKRGEATYVGGFYATVSYACLHTGYSNDTGRWQSDPKGASIPYMKGCAKGVWDAFFGQASIPEDA